MAIKIVTPAGSHIDQVITGAISAAGSDVAQFDFNGVTVLVRSDSNPDLIHRDWSRAMSGYINSPVGPYPHAELTPVEVENDAQIEAENERRRQERNAAYEAKAAAKQAATVTRLAAAPSMAVRDPAAWQGWKDGNTDPYGSAIIRYAEMWARLMQAEIDSGAALEDIAEETGDAADTEGITGFMYGAAVHCLATCWAHGDQLRKWHNGRYGVGADAKGTVNPAVLTIGPAGDRAGGAEGRSQ
jgi:hypothetical protein